MVSNEMKRNLNKIIKTIKAIDLKLKFYTDFSEIKCYFNESSFIETICFAFGSDVPYVFGFSGSPFKQPV